MGTGIVQRIGAGRQARRSAQEWRALLETHQRSGETRRRFWARHGIALSTFGWWQRRVRAQAFAVVESAGNIAETNALFVELAAPVAAERTAAAWDLELELGAGVVLRLRRGGAC
jgi:hypothetical protein